MKVLRVGLVVVVVMLLALQAGFSQKKTPVELLSAKVIKSDKNIQGGVRRLIGNVKFKQDSTIMTCDSAYFYATENMFDAFSNVHLYKMGSSDVDVRSEFLRHNGDTKMAHFRNNVVLRDTQIILRTDSLDYDTDRDIGYYLYNGEIEDSATTLTSVKGHYFHHRQMFLFTENVVINHNNNEYKLLSDSVRYHTDTEMVYFLGPTQMYNDTNYMYAEFGWYNTKINEALFKQNALYTNPKQSLEADSIFIDREKAYSKAYSNVIATDTTEQLVITGNYLEARKSFKYVFVTDSAMAIGVFEGDSLYMHADTLISFMITDSLQVPLCDTMPVDSLNPLIDTTITYRVFKAFYRTKIFKSNFQAKCDSLFFSMNDSIMQFHGDPVLWAEDNQITARYIEGYIVNQALDKFKLYKTGLVINMQDSIHYNQIKGKEVVGYFRDNDLTRIDVLSESETIYFPVDTEKDEIMGVNIANSKNISIYMANNEVKRIVYRSQPKSTLHPLEKVTEDQTRMKEFEWRVKERPASPLEIFIWNSPMRSGKGSKGKRQRQKAN